MFLVLGIGRSYLLLHTKASGGCKPVFPGNRKMKFNVFVTSTLNEIVTDGIFTSGYSMTGFIAPI